MPSRAPSVPGALVGDREDDVAVALRELDLDPAGAVLERVLEQLAEDERERGRAVARERDLLEPRLDVAAAADPLHEHRAQPVDSSASSTSSSRCSVSASCTAAIARMRLTECSSASRGSTPSALRLQAQERGDGLEVVLDAVVDLLREHAAHHRAPVLERDGGVVRDRLEQRALLVGERRVPVGDELADLAALPAERRADGVLAGAALGPRDAAVLEHERGAGRLHRVHRRLDDRLERLLEVERLGDRLGDLRERLELGDAALRVGVELRVDDRLRDLARDRLEQLDLVRPELARLARADVERARELVAREDRHGEDRLVLRLGQVRELLPARVEMRLGGDRDRARARRRPCR